MKYLGTFVLILVAFALGAVTHGYALSVLWGWFAVPLGAPSISMASALGISTLVRLMLFKYDDAKTEDGKGFTHYMAVAITVALIVPAFALLAGYIYLQFV